MVCCECAVQIEIVCCFVCPNFEIFKQPLFRFSVKLHVYSKYIVRVLTVPSTCTSFVKNPAHRQILKMNDKVKDVSSIKVFSFLNENTVRKMIMIQIAPPPLLLFPFLMVPLVQSFILCPSPQQYSQTGHPCDPCKKKSIQFSLSALPKEELERLTEEYLATPSPDWWADDYVFRGPVIGPLVKKDFIETLKGVAGGPDSLEIAFPDLNVNVFGITADDPIEPNRVWYFVRPRGNFTGPFEHPVVGTIEPTGAEYIAPPEARSVVFNDEGKIVYQTVGYVTDRFTGDTTGGRGAVFGMYAVMGQEIDATVGSPTTTLLQKLAMFLPGIPKSYSDPKDWPKWWKDTRKGAEK